MVKFMAGCGVDLMVVLVVCAVCSHEASVCDSVSFSVGRVDVFGCSVVVN